MEKEMKEFVSGEIARLVEQKAEVETEFDTAKTQAEAQYNQLVGFYQGRISATDALITEWQERLEEKEEVVEVEEVDTVKPPKK